MKKRIIIAAVIILVVAAVTAATVLLPRYPATDTISLTNDGQGETAAGEVSGINKGQGTGEASGINGGHGEGQGAAGEAQNTTAEGQDAGAAEASGGDTSDSSGETGGQEQHTFSGIRELNIYTYDDKLVELVRAYVRRHPELIFEVNGYNYVTEDKFFNLSLINESIQSDSKDVVDIYCVPDVYSHEFIKGNYSRHACTYKELGIDVDAALKKADIPQNIIDAGINPDGEVIALPYMTGASVFMYRRSVAQKVWGTDDPDKIAGIIGAGTNKWDRFMEAAQTLKEHGCYIVPGYIDIAFMVDTSFDASEINPKWLEFMDVSKKMLYKGYMKDTQYWSDEWINEMNGKGDKPVFGFVIPYEYFIFLSTSDDFFKSTAGDWAICVPPFNTIAGGCTGILVNKDSPNKDVLGPLIEWLTLDCSESGLQHGLANHTLADRNGQMYGYNGGEWPVISGTVLKNAECSIDFLGGQNIYPVIYDALNTPTGRHDNYGIEIYTFSLWLEETRAYLAGIKDRETAVADYIKAEKEEVSSLKKTFEEYGISFLLP